MYNLSENYNEMDTLFVTLQRDRRSFIRLKRGSVKEHFMHPILTLINQDE